jgi:hypothetical protein
LRQEGFIILYIKIPEKPTDSLNEKWKAGGEYVIARSKADEAISPSGGGK